MRRLVSVGPWKDWNIVELGMVIELMARGWSRRASVDTERVDATAVAVSGRESRCGEQTNLGRP